MAEAILRERRRGIRQARRQKRDLQAERIVALEQKLVQKNEVVAELLQEHVQLKKELGEL